MELKYPEGKWFIEDDKWTNEHGAIGIDISSEGEDRSVTSFITVWSNCDDDKEAEDTAKIVVAAPSLYELAKQIERILFIRSAGDMLSSSEFEVLVKAREIIKEVEQ